MHAIGAVNSNGVIRPYGPLEAAARISRVDRVAAQVTAEPPVATAPPPAAAAAKTCKPYDPTVEWVPEGLADETALFAKNWADFPIAPGALVHRAKWVLAEPQFGLRDDSCLAPDFEFCAPFIGPLKKEEFLGALGNFKLQVDALCRSAVLARDACRAADTAPTLPAGCLRHQRELPRLPRRPLPARARVVGDADDRGAHGRRDADARRADGEGADAAAAVVLADL